MSEIHADDLSGAEGVHHRGHPFGDRPVLVEPIIIDGRRVLLVRPVVARRGVPRTHVPRDAVRQGYGMARTPRRRLRAGVVVALVLGVLAAVGWVLWFVLSVLLAHAVEVGVVLALVVLLASAGGGCTVVVTHIRH